MKPLNGLRKKDMSTIISTYHDIGDGSILGCFTESEYGNRFEFSTNNEGCAFSSEYPHIVWVGNDKRRFAMVKKTVAYIVVDEDETGAPVVEKWNIKAHRKYYR